MSDEACRTIASPATAVAAKSRKVVIGPRVVEFGPDNSPSAFLKPLVDSAQHVRAGDWDAVRKRLHEDGYVFVRGGISSEAVDAARLRVLQHFVELGSSNNEGADTPTSSILDPVYAVEEGVLMKNCGLGCVPFMEGRNPVTHSPELLKVIEGKELRRFFEGVFGTPNVRSFDFKWLRAVPREKFTGAHVDNVYMSRGSPRLLTTWIPFGENPLERGGLCICEGSNRLESFAPLRETYGRLDHERDGLRGSGWFSHDPVEISKLFGPCTWRTADFAPGDFIVFTMQTVHMSTTNVTDFARISADVRFQPADEKIDSRYVGSEAGGTMDSFVKNMTISGAWQADENAGREASKSLAAQASVELPLDASDLGIDLNKQQAVRSTHPVETLINANLPPTTEMATTIVQLRDRWGFPVSARARANLR